LSLANGDGFSRTELGNILCAIRTNRGQDIKGMHLSSCLFGTQDLADYIFRRPVCLLWMSGYSTAVDWLDSFALDLLFFNLLVTYSRKRRRLNTEAKVIKEVAAQLHRRAGGLIRELGFGIYVRKQGTGGAKNLFDA